MLSKHWTLLQLYAVTIFAKPAPSPHNIRSSQHQKPTIKWEGTTETLGMPSARGTLTVPLDYTLPASENNTMILAMLKVPATKEPKKGTVLLNYGGPGNDGTSYLALYPEIVLAMTGGHFDLIGPDPRGTGQSLPIDCFPDAMKERRSYETLTPATTNSSDVAPGNVWSYTKVFAGKCAENAAHFGALMSTAFVARDYMQVVDALALEGEDGMLRYWGVSYGTYLGEVLAAMFPDRIERMVLDGVLHPDEYQDGWEYNVPPAGDVVLKEFAEQCIEAGSKNSSSCALFRPNLTAEGLINKVHALIEEAKIEPIVLGTNITTDVVNYDALKEAFDTSMRQGLELGPKLARYYDIIMERDSNAFNHSAYLSARKNLVQDGIPLADGVHSIRCSDSMTRTNHLADIQDKIQKLLEGGYMTGDYYSGSHMMCALWRIAAKERYEGDFKAKTKNPVLLIGSPYDVRTPITGAYAAQGKLEGSVVLQHNGVGHTTMYSPGQCAIKASADYFDAGTLPSSGTVCGQDFGIFSGKTIGDSIW